MSIARLARAERGRRNQQEFLIGLSCAIGHTVRAGQLLGLDATDRVRAGLNSGYIMAVSGSEISGRVFFPEAASIAALSLAESLADSLAEQRVFLWLKQSENCGAVILTAREALSACEAIRAFDGDAVSVLSEDHTEGFIFDKNEGDAVETFEVSVWGSGWFGAVRSHGFGALYPHGVIGARSIED